MDVQRLVLVLEVCLPVFALIGLGAWLRRRDWLREEPLHFINQLIYYLSLPALIFMGVVRQPFARLLDPSVIVSTLGAVAAISVIFGLLALGFKIPRALRAPFIFGTFFANVTYMGFPLATNAFGESDGLAYAGIVNAFTMPAFNILAFVMMHHWGSQNERGWRPLLKTMVNPIIIASLGGVLVAGLGELLGARGWIGAHPIASAPLRLAASFMQLVGAMGLPLALISVGAALRLRAVSENFGALSLVIFGKLCLTPMITWAILATCYPEAEVAARGVAVMLMATPASVASYVISRRLNIAPDFVAAHLTISTALSVITIPVWLYLLYA